MEDNKTMQEMLDSFEGSLKSPHRNEIIQGKVVMVTDDEIVVNIGYKADGIVPKNEVSDDEIDLRSNFKEDQEIEVYVLKTDNGDGNVLLSIKKLAADQEFKELETIFENGTIISVVARQIVKGGIISYYKNVKGFIPASHISLKYENDLTSYLGQTLEVKVIEYDKKKKRAVFSRKELLKSELNDRKEEFFSKINEGDIVEGTVKRLANFGAFIDIGGFDGLVHTSEISYGRIKSPADTLKLNQKVNVKVLNIDKENEKISLSIKQSQEHPWESVTKKYEVGTIHKGKVVNTTTFGAFVELEPGVEGLVHISQISEERIEKPSDVLKDNEIYDFRVIEIDLDERKIKLSKKLNDKKIESTEEQEQQNGVEELVVANECENKLNESSELQNSSCEVIVE